jgi:hypothetical protein
MNSSTRSWSIRPAQLGCKNLARVSQVKGPDPVEVILVNRDPFPIHSKNDGNGRCAGRARDDPQTAFTRRVLEDTLPSPHVVRRPSTKDLQMNRAIELFNKTNQFNTSGERYTLSCGGPPRECFARPVRSARPGRQ